MSIALRLVQQFHGHLECAYGLFAGVVNVAGQMVGAGVKGIVDNVVAELNDFGFLQPSQNDDCSPHLFTHTGSSNGLRGVALVAGQADDGILTEVLWRAVDKLVAVDPAGL